MQNDKQQNVLKRGTQLLGGTYKITRVLGQGGFGITYLAEQSMLKKSFAIKEFFIQNLCARDEQLRVYTLTQPGMVGRYRQKFIKEAQMIVQLDHPGIVKVSNIFEENGTVYYVMEFVEGKSLSEIIKKTGPMPEEKALHYVLNVAEALEYIHQRNVNHLDVKPANIMVRKRDDMPILIDFGVAKQYDEQKDQTSTTPPGVSHGYSPFEQYKRGGVSKFSPQADIYSLGATFYKLLTGDTPPDASDILNDGVPHMPDTISPNIKKAIEMAMQPKVVDRPKDIRDFIDMISMGEVASNTPAQEDENSDLEDVSGELVCEPNPETPQTLSANEMYELGEDSYYGRNGKPQDYAEAVKWYLKAAEQEHVDAQNSLGYMYENGLGVTQDYKVSVGWYRKAAEKGDADAQFSLGNLYQSGQGVAQDYHEAVKWFLMSAENGDMEAQYELGELFESGLGTDKNIEEAIEWYCKAADKGYVDAQSKLGRLFLYGEGISTDYAEAMKWFLKAAGQDDAYAQNSLGHMFHHGKGVAQNLPQAMFWYKKAANQGDEQALYNIGFLYENGLGVEKDLSEAKAWYEKAAAQGYDSAIEKLRKLK